MVEAGFFGLFRIQRSEIDLFGVAAFAVDPAVGRDCREPALNAAFTAVFFEQSRAILAAGNAIGPHVGQDIFGFGSICAAREEDVVSAEWHLPRDHAKASG